MSNSGVDRYRSPESGNKTTIFFPANSSRFATSTAANKAAPEEMPHSIPSLRATALPYSNADPFSTAIISS